MRNAEFYIFNNSNENREVNGMFFNNRNNCSFDRVATISPLAEKLHKLFHI